MCCAQNLFLHQHCVQVMNKKKNKLKRGIKYTFFILVLYGDLKLWYRDNPRSYYGPFRVASQLHIL